MIRRLLAWGFLLLTVAGCVTAPTVKIERGAFSLAYADLGRIYAVLEYRMAALCKDGKLDPATCQQAERFRDALTLLDQDMRKAILNPDVEVDWEKIGQALSLILKVAGAL